MNEHEPELTTADAAPAPADGEASPLAETPPVAAPAAAPEDGSIAAAAPVSDGSDPVAPDSAESDPGGADGAEPDAVAADGAEPIEAAADGAEPIEADDPEEAARRKLALLAEAQSVAETPDRLPDGRAPDDRALSERMRAVDAVWRRVGSAGSREAELRQRLAEFKAAYADARTRRAESRAVERARAGETKRALLVEAFSLAQQLDPSLAQLVSPSPRPSQRGRPTPAMLARRVAAAAADTAQAESPASGSPAPPTEESAPDGGETATGDDVVSDPVVAGSEISEPVAESDPAEPEAAEPDTAEPDVAPSDVAPSVTAEPDVAESVTADGGAPPDVDLAALARRAQQLQAEWTGAGFAGREVEQELGTLFRRYLQIVFDRQREHIGHRVAARRDLVTRARALAERAAQAEGPALADLVREAKTLQAEWKAGDAAPRGPENTAWQRFSGALSAVFAVRRGQQETARSEREEIVAAVVALASAKDPFRAMRDVGGLLARWRKAPPVPGPVYTELKARLDAEVGRLRERADSERAKRDVEDSKAAAERAKWAARVVKEAQRSPRAPRKQQPAGSRPASQGAEGALAAALAAATFGRQEEVASDVDRLERTVSELRGRLSAAEQGAVPEHPDTLDTAQGFTIRAAVDRGADNPVRIRAELERAENALARRRSELEELESSARGLGISGQPTR